MQLNSYFSINRLLIGAIACTIAIFSPPSHLAAESIAQQTSKDFTMVAKKAIPAVVAIKVKTTSKQKGALGDYSDFFGDDLLQQFFGFSRQPQDPRPITGQASGFIISSDGHVLTNSHVVSDTSDIVVLLNDGRELPATVVGQDASTDVALLKIDAENLPYLQLGNSDNLEIGQWAIAIGNPFGLKATLTVGVVSAKGRNDLDLANIEDFIQTDAAINRGNSGGPLLNLDGSVIGMNTAILTSGNSGGYVGIGFAIPSNILKHVMDQILQNGSVSRGFMGVSLQHVDKDLAHAFGLNEAKGALVADVSKGSPADQAGIKQGDVIVEYNKQTVKDVGDLRNAISLMNPGTKLNLTIIRDGKTLAIPLVVGTYPTSAVQTASTVGNKLGFEVQAITPEIARSQGVTEELGTGVIISKVQPGSVASWAGLKKGAVVLAVNQKKVGNVAEFNAALAETESGKPVLLLIKQGESVRYISLRVQ